MSQEKNMHSYQCPIPTCGYIYTPAYGDKKGKIPKGTAFEDLPDNWRCPLCGAVKSSFKELDY